MEIGLALFFQSVLLAKYCIYGFHIVMYTLNRLPFHVLAWQRPYELL